MTQLVFDLYDAPPTDGGVFVVRITKEHYGMGTFYEHHLASMGAGRIVFEREQTIVDADTLSTVAYVIVRDLDLHPSNDTANVIGGFWPEQTDATVISDPGEGLILRGGPSTIAYLKRAVMGPESLSPFGGPHSIVDGYWRWGTDSYGGVLRRALFEANYQTPPGLPAIATLTVGADNIHWNDDDDSNGDPWPYFTDEFRTQCGTDLLTLADQLYGFGIEWDMDARTFDMYAYNADGFGTDRSSSTFAAGKVRFVEGVNIRDKLQRKVEGYLPLTHLLVRTVDYPQGAWVESSTYTPGDPVRKGVYQTGDISGDPSASAAVIARAQRVMALRRLAEEGISFYVAQPADDELQGHYQPGPNYPTGATVTNGAHYWVGDWITIHSGTEDYDYDNATKRIESLSYELSEAGEWDVLITVGARLLGASPGLSGAVGATVQLPLQLCIPDIEAGAEVETELIDWDWDHGGVHVVPAYPEITQASVNSPISGSVNAGGYTNDPVGDSTYGLPASNWAATPVTPGQAVRLRASFRDSGVSDTSWIQVRWLQGLHNGATMATLYDESTIDIGNAASFTPVEETYIVPPSATGMTILVDGNTEVTSLSIHLVEGGTDAIPGDGPVSEVGTSIRAARCDHTHPAGGTHDHDADYAALGHDHNADYEPLAVHTADATAAHAASAVAFTPAGTIAATNVQAAIEEVAAEAAGGGIPATIVDAKGDLIAATAADTVARLAVGTDGQYLKADSTQASGLAWDTPAGGSTLPDPWMIVPETGTVYNAVFGGAANVGFLIPVTINKVVQITGVRYRQAAMSGTVSFALYDASYNRLATTGSIAPAANTTQSVAFTAAYTPPSAGKYYIGYSMSTATSTFGVAGTTGVGILSAKTMLAAHPLPATFVPAGISALVVACHLTVTGGWTP